MTVACRGGWHNTYLELWIAKWIFKNKVTVELVIVLPSDDDAFSGGTDFGMKYHRVTWTDNMRRGGEEIKLWRLSHARWKGGGRGQRVATSTPPNLQ